jgi:A/G-specific adenine glycosylase
MTFCDKILEYYAQNKRDLPWRKTKNPYKIWLSEIIMQQTRISQGTAYYLKFINKYPTVFHLAKADEQDVLLLWQGLGYYSRARNLHHTAKEIANNKGEFPKTYKNIVRLKGIGEYTASAILSICYKLPLPAVDGNVLRIVSRIFGIREPINQSITKKTITDICNKLICKENPGDFNQALMDFGSMQCTPSKPDCVNCIFNNECIAFQTNSVALLPVKIKTRPKVKEYYHYFIIRFEGKWRNLYDFPLISDSKKHSKEKIISQFINTFLKNDTIGPDIQISKEIKHILSHKILIIRFYTINIKEHKKLNIRQNLNDYKIINSSEFTSFPFPQVIRKFLSGNAI